MVFRDAKSISEDVGKPDPDHLDALQLARRKVLTKEIENLVAGNNRRKMGLQLLGESLRLLDKMDGMFGGFKTHTGEPMRDEIDAVMRRIKISEKVFSSADNSLLQAQTHVKARRRMEDKVWDPKRVKEMDEADEAERALREMMAGKESKAEAEKEAMADELKKINRRVDIAFALDTMLGADLDEERREMDTIQKNSLTDLIFLGARANESASEMEQLAARMKKVIDSAEDGLQPLMLQWNGFEEAEGREGKTLPDFVEESEASVADLLANTHATRDSIRALVRQMKADGTNMEHRVFELSGFVDTLSGDLKRLHIKFDDANRQFADDKASLIRRTETEKLLLQSKLDSKYAAEMDQLDKAKASLKQLSKDAAEKDQKLKNLSAEVTARSHARHECL